MNLSLAGQILQQQGEELGAESDAVRRISRTTVLELGAIGTQLLFENDRVRVWDLTLEPGEATAWHQHHHDYLFVVIENGHVYTEYVDGTIEHQSDEVGYVEMRQADQAHQLVNNNAIRYRNIVIELK